MKKPIREPGLTEEMIDASVEKNCAKMMSAPGNKERLAQLLDHNAPAVLQLIAPLSEKYDHLISITNEVAKIVGPISACKQGCSHCCHQAVGIGGTEAAEIGRYIGKVPAMVTIDLEGTQPDPLRYARTACPFLVDSQCSIYPVRPLACRTYFNVSDYPSTCNLYDYEGGSVPTLNMKPIWFTQSRMAFRGRELIETFGDIREYFPEEFAKSQSKAVDKL